MQFIPTRDELHFVNQRLGSGEASPKLRRRDSTDAIDLSDDGIA